MDRSTPRLPSPWWVLLPGALLVVVGVRAVSAETERAREDARERARSSAMQVARAFETLVDEYLSPLPEPDSLVTLDEAEDATRHLDPTWAVTTDGRWVPIGRFREEHPRRDVPADIERRDAELVEAIFARLAAATGEDALAEAELFAGAAAAVETQWAEGVLRIGAAHAEVRRGNAVGALRQVERILRLPAAIRTPEGSSLRPTYPWLAAAEVAIDALHVEAGPDGDGDGEGDGNSGETSDGEPDGGDGPSDWLLEVLDVVAADPWGVQSGRREGVLARIQEQLATPEGQAAFAATVAARETVRIAAEAPIAWTSAVIWRERAVEHLVVQRRVVLDESPGLDSAQGATAAWIGGAIPLLTVKQRVFDEIDAATRDGAQVALRTADGAIAVGNDEDASGTTAGILEEVALTGFADGWRVEARVTPPTGLPKSAWLLGGALALATVMLALGAIALTRAAAHHARLAEERRNFLDHVAHEVRTPASAMLALSEELERGHVEPGRYATYHEHLVKEARRLADLVDETLDLARLEGGRLVAKRERADLRDVAHAAFDAARVDTSRLTIDLPGAPVDVNVDVAALRRALRNLIDNALKHGAADRPVEFRLAVDGQLATITVRDHGRGIPPDHVARVFERFHRVPSPTHDVKGVGLGLALVREVAEAHGGSVRADNARGGGALFTLTLPIEGAS